MKYYPYCVKKNRNSYDKNIKWTISLSEYDIYINTFFRDLLGILGKGFLIIYLFSTVQDLKRTDPNVPSTIHSNACLVAYICRVWSLHSSSILVIISNIFYLIIQLI